MSPASTTVVPLQSLRPGQVIRLRNRDGYRCQGLVQKVDQAKRMLQLTNVTCLTTANKEPGFQDFHQSDIEDLDLVDNTMARRGGTPRKPKPEEGDEERYSLSRPDRRNENRHINQLVQLDMPGVLQQKQYKQTPKMQVLTSRPGQPRELPRPEQDPHHMEGEKFQDRLQYEFRAVREACWNQGTDSPPELKCVARELHMITSESEESWAVAMKAIQSEAVLAVALEGQTVSRTGKLSIISVASKDAVFLFDFVSLPKLLDKGSRVRALLESKRVIKVIHDGRMMADMLKHQFDLVMENIYDTLASHLCFVPWALYAGFMPRYASSHNNLVRLYLGVGTKHLFFPHIRRLTQENDSAIWMERPIPKQLEFGAASNVMFLLDLRRLTTTARNSAFYRVSDALQSVVRDAGDMDAQMHQLEPELPESVRDTMPNWGPKPHRVKHLGLLEEQERWVHNTVGQIDPNVIFSRDTLHQKTDFSKWEPEKKKSAENGISEEIDFSKWEAFKKNTPGNWRHDSKE